MAEKSLIAFGAVPKAKGPILRYAPKLVTEEGKQLQRFLNGFPGIVLREDGQLGQGTSDAFKQVTGRFLTGDRRRNSAPPSAHGSHCAVCDHRFARSCSGAKTSIWYGCPG